MPIHLTPELEGALQRAIARSREGVTIPNEAVARNELTMDEFDKQMRSVQIRRFCKNAPLALRWVLNTLVTPFVVLNCQSSNRFDLFVAGSWFLYLAQQGYEDATNQSSPLSPIEEKSVALHEKVRPALREVNKRIPDLKEKIHEQAAVIHQFGVAQCFELCLALSSELLRLPELKGKYVTQLALKDPENPKNNHTVLVISEKLLPEDFSKLEQLKGCVVVDPWYNTVIPTSEIPKMKNDYPLLNDYTISDTDYDMRVTARDIGSRVSPGSNPNAFHALSPGGLTPSLQLAPGMPGSDDGSPSLAS